MEQMEMATIKAKKIECLIGILFLIPPILGVVFFIFSVFGASCHSIAQLDELYDGWTACWGYSNNGGGGGGMSAAPIYLGIMALAGAYLIKDSIKYLFVKIEKKEKK